MAELYDRYHDSLVRLLYRRTGDRDCAEDLAQEVFVRALETPPTNPRPWLFAVALNLAREDGRRAVRRGRRLELLKGEVGAATAPAADAALETDERTAAVRAALETLSEQDRSALLLKAEGFSYDEIAAALGLAKGSVGTTLARARRRLVESFHGQGRVQHVAH
ncbi:MAG TPA: sigma-70 family RNA polymerase sigma factor [Gemmatimonadales bacterium]|nr:sigma-70 family RNA polymerase sigma factor [Gemmatimonadales bacterium]